MKRAEAFQRIPELYRPQICAGRVAPDPAGPRPLFQSGGGFENVEAPCPTPAEWFDAATGTPVCDTHKEILERVQHERAITPP